MSKRKISIPDASSLRAAALHYLARYASSSGNLRRVLLARIERAARHYPELRADNVRLDELRQDVERIVEANMHGGYIDDAAYAVMKARRARAQGKSASAIAANLHAKGLDGVQVKEALVMVDDGDTEAEYKAALRLARRKRLGRFRGQQGDETTRRRDLAALARAGFSQATALRVLRADFADEEEAA